MTCTDGGEVFTWGQLGDGTTKAIHRPRLVASLQKRKINREACGLWLRPHPGLVHQ